jgi:hypothetical protein
MLPISLDLAAEALVEMEEAPVGVETELKTLVIIVRF